MDLMGLFSRRGGKRSERRNQPPQPGPTTRGAKAKASPVMLPRLLDSRPGPWLKKAPMPAPIHFGTPMGEMRLLDSGAVYDPRGDGWRQRRDIELEMQKGDRL